MFDTPASLVSSPSTWAAMMKFGKAQAKAALANAVIVEVTSVGKHTDIFTNQTKNTSNLQSTGAPTWTSVRFTNSNFNNATVTSGHPSSSQQVQSVFNFLLHSRAPPTMTARAIAPQLKYLTKVVDWAQKPRAAVEVVSKQICSLQNQSTFSQQDAINNAQPF